MIEGTSLAGSDDCPFLTAETLQALQARTLPRERKLEVDEHVEGCAFCDDLLIAALPWLAGADELTENARGLWQPGDLVGGRYRIDHVLGRGASGTVYAATDQEVSVKVALKVLHRSHANDLQWIARLRNEVRLAQEIQHPNVCRVFGLVSIEGERFLILDLGQHALTTELSAAWYGRAFRSRLDDAIGIARGLTAIHDAGIIHRDVKPANILRMSKGQLALSDFGLATTEADQQSRTVGTTAYMAPELLRNARATEKSDVWALGATLHEVLFCDEDVAAGASPLSAAEQAAQDICARCLAPNPGARPRAADLTRSLERLGALSPLELGLRRHTGILGFVGGTLSGVVAVAAALLLRPPAPSSESTRKPDSPSTATVGEHSGIRLLSPEEIATLKQKGMAEVRAERGSSLQGQKAFALLSDLLVRLDYEKIREVADEIRGWKPLYAPGLAYTIQEYADYLSFSVRAGGDEDEVLATGQRFVTNYPDSSFVPMVETVQRMARDRRAARESAEQDLAGLNQKQDVPSLKNKTSKLYDR